MYIDNLAPNLTYVAKGVGKVILYLILVEPIYTLTFLVRLLKILM
jgi:hypothetical protein